MQMKPIPAVDPTQFRAALYPKIDPKIGQDAWRGTLNRQINQSINAGRMVPLRAATTAFRDNAHGRAGTIILDEHAERRRASRAASWRALAV